MPASPAAPGGWVSAFAARFLYGSQSREIVAVAILSLAFLAAAIVVAIQVHRADGEQANLRAQDLARTYVLELQIDEETGLRGFAIGRQPIFLEPYRRAAAALPGALAGLRSEVARAGIPGAVALVDRERDLNARWTAEVAAPLLAGGGTSEALGVRGKQFIDGFRAADRELAGVLRRHAEAVQRSVTASFAGLLVLIVLAVVAALSAALALGMRQATLAHRVDTERIRADAEKRIGDKLQEAFQQQQLPALAHLGFSATYMPAATEANVGGDWYDAFELPDGRIMFSIGDVAGHGVDAAVTMSRARQAIIAAALGSSDPGDVFERANITLMLQDTKFATAICGYVDPDTLIVRYATAGHPPGILVDADGKARHLDYDGLPLGVAHDATYQTFEIQATHEALLVLYTDGLVEYGRDFVAGEHRLLAAVAEIAGQQLENPADAIRDAIFTAYEPTDDVAIMTITFAQHAPEASAAGRDRWTVGFRGIRAPLLSQTAVAPRKG